MVNKNILRKVYLEKRKGLDIIEYRHRNKLLTQKLIAFVEETKVKNIHIFLPIEKFKEVDLLEFIAWTYMQEGINLVASVSDLHSSRMSHYKMDQYTTLVNNKWGIPEPQGAEPYDIKSLDCIFVPMVIGSKSGHRIGYGKGYYDNFLKECESSALFVGLGLGPLLEGDIFSEGHDIKMDWMITPYQEFKMIS